MSSKRKKERKKERQKEQIRKMEGKRKIEWMKNTDIEIVSTIDHMKERKNKKERKKESMTKWIQWPLCFSDNGLNYSGELLGQKCACVRDALNTRHYLKTSF